MKRFVLCTALLACSLGAQAQGTWQTTLHGRDAQGHAVALDSAQAVFFYDSVLDVTWLREANAPSLKTFAQAKAWADGLQLGGHEDWRLPTTLDTGLPGCARVTYTGGDCGYNVPTQVGSGDSAQYSEMAHLFHVTLGNASGYTPTGTFRGWDSQGTSWGLANTAGFTGLQAGNYWSGTGVTGNANYAWTFHPGLGLQSLQEKGVLQQAMALRDGDVLTAVPEPSSWMMAGVGALLLGWLQRRRRV